MTSSAETFQQFEDDAKVLESVGQAYPPTSPEFNAVRRAALALTYVVMHAPQGFATFMEEMNRDLSAEERDELRGRYGIGM